MDELVKALRTCARQTYCDNCPRYTDPDESAIACAERTLEDAADAIERLVAEVDRKDKVIHGLLDAVDRKNTDIKKWKASWKTAYKLYEATKESKGEQDGTEQNNQ